MYLKGAGGGLAQVFFFKVFFLLLTVDTFTSDSTDNSSIRSSKNSKVKVFLNFFYLLMVGSGKVITDPNPEGPKTYGSGTLITSYIKVITV
jgi:hypothetical protein